MKMLNRSAVSVKLTQAFVDWINSLEPEEEGEGDVLLEEVNQEGTIYLIPEVDEKEDFDRYIRENYRLILENELASWEDDERFWPEQRDFELFSRWLQVEPQVMVFDLDQSTLMTARLPDDMDLLAADEKQR